MIDDEIRRARKLLETLMTISGLNRQEVDRRLGQGRGYASQVLTGRVELKYRHILAFLEVVDVEPGMFFRVLFPDSTEQRQGTAGRMAERLFRQIHRAGYRDRPEPLPRLPAIDTEELERRIGEAIREVLGHATDAGNVAHSSNVANADPPEDER
ncbi:MAG TPA: hypothetical protein VGR07_22885 [Thermoanaerobaculia bacterium]|jgi:hypothetical protein|nr:hypothetical protein [Thermoanaerobaculia bacterium]